MNTLRSGRFFEIVHRAPLALLPLMLLAGCSLGGGRSVDVVVVEQRPIRQYVDERAKTRLPKIHLITMPYNGRIQPIVLEEGDAVQEGQVVAQLVSEDIENEVAKAKAVVERLARSIETEADMSIWETAVAQAQDFVRAMEETVAAAYSRTQRSEANKDYFEKYAETIKNLYERNAVEKLEFDEAVLNRSRSQLEYDESISDWRTNQAYQLATNRMPEMIRQWMSNKRLKVAELEKQQQEAEVALAEAELRQERAKMTSPVDGVVLERPTQNERYLPAGEVLLEIGRLADLEVEAEILSEDVYRIRPGNAVEIYGPAVAEPGAFAAGTVVRIEPEGFTKTSSLGVEQQRVLVLIRFAEGVLDDLLETRRLGVDYRVRARIITEEKSAALVLPRSAVFRSPEGTWQALAAVEGRLALRDVELGLTNEEEVEVLSGLTAGEAVVLSPDNTLSNGLSVSPNPVTYRAPRLLQ